MGAICRLQHLPKAVRFLAGGLAIAAGVPLLVAPVPGGLVLVAAGAFLLMWASVRIRSGFRRRLEGIHRLRACDRCPARPGLPGRRQRK